MTCVSVSIEQPLKLSCFNFISIQSLTGPNLPYENYCTQENNFVENKLSWWLLSNRASKRHKKYFRETLELVLQLIYRGQLEILGITNSFFS